MAYTQFAYWYDRMNGTADYDRLTDAILQALRKNGVSQGIVADLGCGTGEMSLRLAAEGYDMIAVDNSADMLAVFREKMWERENTEILLLQQDLAELDLYGTIHAAVSTFDTLNHLPKEQLQTALQKVSLFTEPGGVLIFDANTPYKHAQILGDNTFPLEDEWGNRCLWQNHYRREDDSVHISLDAYGGENTPLWQEDFYEYAYPATEWERLLDAAGFTLLDIADGETFGPVGETSQRYLITAKKRDT